MKKETKSKLEFSLFRIFYNLFRSLPFKVVVSILGNLFVFGGMIMGLRRKVAEDQLKMVFPEKSSIEIRKILKKMYFDMGRTAAETYFGNSQELFKTVKIKNWENLEKEANKGKGVILATGHLGNWELAGRYIAQTLKMSVIAKKQRNRYFDEFTNRLRIEENIDIIDQRRALKPVLKKLKEGYIVSILIDQNAGKNGILTDFLAMKASTYLGAAKIAIRTGCPIVPCFAVREENGKHLFIAEKPIYPHHYSEDPEALKLLTEEISGHLEKYILEYPSQWFWVHKRWKGKKEAKQIDS